MRRLYAVVLAGGRGGRFWPLSREDRPKPFLPLGGDGSSLLSLTCRRLAGLLDGEDRLFVVGRADHAGLIQQELPGLAPENFLAEPENRGTAAAIALAAQAVLRRDPEGLLLACPSDHLISEPEEFARTVRFAVDCYGDLPAETDPATVVLGVDAGSPDAGFGYIVCGEELAELAGLQCHQVSSYVEKPSRETAKGLVEGEGALWSTGIFLWSAAGYLRLLESYLPEVCGLLDDSAHEAPAQKVSVDHGILEKAESVVVLRSSFSWADIGTWERYGAQLMASEGGNRIRGNFVGLDTEDCIVLSDRRIIGTVGVKNLVIVETEDAILVCHRDSVERVKDLAHEVEQAARSEPPSS